VWLRRIVKVSLDLGEEPAGLTRQGRRIAIDCPLFQHPPALLFIDYYVKMTDSTFSARPVFSLLVEAD
jgi:hypothetical protein